MTIPEIPYTNYISEDKLVEILESPAVKPFTKGTDDYTNISEKFGYTLLKVLQKWSVDSRQSYINALVKFLPVINTLNYPEIFSLDTTKYPSVYRGTNLDSEKLETFIKLTDISKWTPVKLKNGITYMAYFPKKFTYKPHKAMQSWSVNDARAAEFGDAILIGKSKDSKFLMNPEYFHTISKQPDNEFETIHLGKNYKVYLAIESDWFTDIVNNIQ